MWRFITMFTRAHCRSLSRTRCIQSTPYFSKIYSDIILPSMPMSSEWSLHFKFSNQNVVWISHISHACYMLHPSHSPWFGHPTNILWNKIVTKLLTVQSSQTSHHFSLLGPNIHLSTLFSNTSVYAVSLVWDQAFTPIQNNR